MRLIAGAALALLGAGLCAEAPTPERVVEICAGVESPAHCGRLVEVEQLKALPNLAKREGDTLTVSLFPSGARVFIDAIASRDERSYALWDYWSPVNAVVLFLTSGNEIRYAVLQRANGVLTTLPAEPVLAPDRQRLAVADFCSRDCTNELSVWRISRDGVYKEMTFRPPAKWSDVTASWKDGQTLVVQFTPDGAAEPRTQERKLAAPDWDRL